MIIRAALSILAMAAMLAGSASAEIRLTQIGTYSSGVFDGGGAEIVAHDPGTQRIFIVNLDARGIDVVSIANPASPTLLFTIDVTPYGEAANSVAVHGGIVAAAVQNNPSTDPGRAVFFDTNGNFLGSVVVGALPDMITFTPNGRRALVANEGEPNDSYTIDPEGSVSIIDISKGISNLTQANVVTAGFTQFSPDSLDASVRIFGPNASVAQDLEPEYITVSPDSKRAWVTLQEANALGILDINAGKFTQIVGFGFKNHNARQNALDASDRDSAINIAPWPVLGMYQPDSIASYEFFGKTYLVTANEGDARDYEGFAEEVRVGSVTLDAAIFPNASVLRMNANLGRLTVSRVNADTDGDGDFDRLFVTGARSLSIWTADGKRVFDSGDDFEQITAALLPDNFNANNDNNDSFDTRSDNKGPEPEGVVVGKILLSTYAFIGLERIGGVMVYNITNPFSPKFVEYVNNRNFSVEAEDPLAGDLGPEGLIFISALNSPIARPLLIVANEVSGTTTIYRIDLDILP
ncbi:MAG: choice-of-anchor I family protein [Deltaproteobacteria bacterium]